MAPLEGQSGRIGSAIGFRGANLEFFVHEGHFWTTIGTRINVPVHYEMYPLQDYGKKSAYPSHINVPPTDQVKKPKKCTPVRISVPPWLVGKQSN